MSSKHLLSVESGDEDDEDNFNSRKSSLNIEENRYRGKQVVEVNDPVENSLSADELFAYYPQYEDRTIFTGRMRKKQAARLKGGEFQARRQKRRVYFCCISSEINVQEFHEHCTNEIFELKSKWKTRLYGDALCLSKTHIGGQPITSEIRRRKVITSSSSSSSTTTTSTSLIGRTGKVNDKLSNNSQTFSGLERISFKSEIVNESSEFNKQEVFVFEFGAVVFWGFNVSEEKHLLEVVRDFSKKTLFADNEFISGEDDMAFVISADVSRINIANDVIELPEGTTSKQRLSVSYAIAQSSVVSIFEYRIEKKVAEYKFIPETLAKDGIIDDVSSRRVGMMIGDIFVIRHDLNLHTDILDTPDYFWGEEDIYEEVYERVMKYLEMESRVEVINKRLDMLKELLDVLHQQMENAHSTKLEWIIIWLIVLEVVIQSVGAVGGIMGIWSW